MTEESSKRQGINSIVVGLKLVKELVALGRPAPLREVAQAADMHPAKAHRYLVSFVRSGLVKQTPDDSLYDLGPYALELSLACLSRLDAVRLGSTVLEPLVAKELVEVAAKSGPNAPPDREAFEAILTEVRERGLARGVGIRRPGINSFTAPILDYRGRISFALTAFGYEETFETSWDGPIARALSRTAEDLSAQLGHRKEHSTV